GAVGAVGLELLFGGAQSDIGVLPEQVQGGAVAGIARCANRGLDPDRNVAKWNRLLDGALDFGERSAEIPFTKDPREQHRELVASQRHDFTTFPDGGSESRSDMAQEGVAVLMAEAVIDVPEEVQVDEEERELLVTLGCCVDYLAEAYPQGGAVGQAG